MSEWDGSVRSIPVGVMYFFIIHMISLALDMLCFPAAVSHPILKNFYYVCSASTPFLRFVQYNRFWVLAHWPTGSGSVP